MKHTNKSTAIIGIEMLKMKDGNVSKIYPKSLESESNERKSNSGSLSAKLEYENIGNDSDPKPRSKVSHKNHVKEVRQLLREEALKK